MQLSMEEFEYMLTKIRNEGYHTGYQQGQQDVINKQQAELEYHNKVKEPAGDAGIDWSPTNAREVSATLAEAPRGRPHAIPDDDIPF